MKINIKLNTVYQMIFFLTLIFLSGFANKSFAEDYQFVTKWGGYLLDGRFNWPRGIAVDASGNVYVADSDNDRIQKFSLTGPSAGFTISAISGNTSENGTQATFTVKLNTQPTSEVTLPVFIPDSTEGTTTTSSLAFTDLNWNMAQTVTVMGVDDAIVDGNQNYTIILGTAVSGDSNYDGLDPADVSVTNIDNDNAVSSPLGNIDTTSPSSANRIDGHDVYLFSLAFGSTPASPDWNPACDFNGDSIINGDDLVILAANFGKKN